MRQLRDFRSSLESLVAIATSNSQHDRKAPESSPKPQPGAWSATRSNQSEGLASSKPKVATIVRHSSLRADSTPYESRLRAADNPVSKISKPLNIGGDFLQRASKKLSASSSSLSSKFKFMSTSGSKAESKLANNAKQFQVSSVELSVVNLLVRITSCSCTSC